MTTSALPRTTLDLQYHGGEQINFFPAAGVRPFSTNARTIVSTLEIHPSDSMTVQNNVIYTALSSTFIHRTVRTKISLSANPAQASLTAHKQINGDLLVAYLLDPGTALYAGYNTNNDQHRHVFVKMSYLVRF